MTRKNRIRVGMIGTFLAVASWAYATRSVQVLIVRNTRDVELSSAVVKVSSKTLPLNPIPPHSSDYVWTRVSADEATFDVDASWSDGRLVHREACYVGGGPTVFRLELPGDPEAPPCTTVLPAPLGLGVVYAECSRLLARSTY